jgi:hypothetical protein
MLQRLNLWSTLEPRQSKCSIRGTMLPCFKHWQMLELQQCLGFLSGGILLCFNLWRTLELDQCRGSLILSAINSGRILKCRSSLFAACGGGDLDSGGITMNHQFFRSPDSGAIRIFVWGFYSSGRTNRRSNTLLSALP